MKTWLQGKKTYFGAAGLFLAAVLGWWFGTVNEAQAAGMIAAAFGLVGLGARSTRYAELTLAALEEVKQSAAAGKKLDRVQILDAIAWAQNAIVTNDSNGFNTPGNGGTLGGTPK
jgi:hypothetical protein